MELLFSFAWRGTREGLLLHIKALQRFNPDEHWSAAFYAALNHLQFCDGDKVMNLRSYMIFIIQTSNLRRDDQAGFRLDTMATHKLHGTLRASPLPLEQTTKTTILQHFNFPETETTGELCAGVVKAPGLHEKNAPQHLADLEMLSTKKELRPTFFNTQTNLPKEIEFIRVDGGHDECPSHCEVQYWWTVHHLKSETVATMVTSRNSGASYKNRVELQNGCLALAHANLFIPSTLNDSCITNNGKVNQEKLQKNLSSAIDVYVNRVNGGTSMCLYRNSCVSWC